MSKQRKYPASLFFTGLAMNIVVRFFFLFLLALVLIIIGFWVKWCAYAGLAVLLLDVVISLILQLTIRKTAISESDDPEFNTFQDAVSSDDWQKNIMDFVESKIKDNDEDEENTEDDE